MSNKTNDIINDNLRELAEYHLEYWTGTIWAGVIEEAIRAGNPQNLEKLLKDSAKDMFDQEYQPEPEYDLRIDLDTGFNLDSEVPF